MLNYEYKRMDSLTSTLPVPSITFLCWFTIGRELKLHQLICQPQTKNFRFNASIWNRLFAPQVSSGLFIYPRRPPCIKNTGQAIIFSAAGKFFCSSFHGNSALMCECLDYGGQAAGHPAAFGKATCLSDIKSWIHAGRRRTHCASDAESKNSPL